MVLCWIVVAMISYETKAASDRVHRGIITRAGVTTAARKLT